MQPPADRAEHVRLDQPDDNLRSIFESEKRSTQFLESKQAEQEAIDIKLSISMTQAGTVIEYLNNAMLDQQETLANVNTAVSGLTNKLAQLTAQLQHILSQKSQTS